MNTFVAIDLSQLPAPQIVEQLDYEQILAERKAYAISLWPAEQQEDIAARLEMESEPLTKLLEENAYRETVWRQRVPTAVIGLVCTADDADATVFPLDTPVLLTNVQTAVGKAGVKGTLAVSLQAIADQTKPYTIVVRVWEVFEYLESLGEGPQVNHSTDPALIAINLNEFAEKASEHRQNLADLKTLRTLLTESRSRKLLDTNKPTYSAVRASQRAGNSMFNKPLTVRCWVFQGA